MKDRIFQIIIAVAGFLMAYYFNNVAVRLTMLEQKIEKIQVATVTATVTQAERKNQTVRLVGQYDALHERVLVLEKQQKNYDGD